jgi:hypothetical protein
VGSWQWAGSSGQVWWAVDARVLVPAFCVGTRVYGQAACGFTRLFHRCKYGIFQSSPPRRLDSSDCDVSAAFHNRNEFRPVLAGAIYMKYIAVKCNTCRIGGRPMQLLEFLPFGFGRECGRAIVVQPDERCQPINCSACGRSHGTLLLSLESLPAQYASLKEIIHFSDTFNSAPHF